MSAQIQSIPVDRLYPHPDNPRLQLREDVVERLAAEISRNGFRPEHAVLVRPYGDGWQLVSGHHRLEAAKRAGLVEVPAWVRDMDDEEAFMQLVLSNMQGELSPLEIGMHALKAVPPAERKSGEGFKAYAERIGMTGQYIGQLRAAAEVLLSLRNSSFAAQVADKAKHLYEISKAPREVWPALVTALVHKGWTVAETAKHVEQVKAFEVPDLVYANDWLPLAEVVARYLDAPERFTPRTVTRLVMAAREVESWIEANAPHELSGFLDWLHANRGGESWDYRAVIAYQQRLIASRYEVEGWHHGDWREHVDKLDDESVSLVLTDPPYGMGYQSNHRSEAHDRIAADATIEDATRETAAAVAALLPKLTTDAHVLVFCTWRNEYEVRNLLREAGLTIRGSLVWAKNNTSMGNLDGSFAPKHERIVHAVKGNPKLYRRAPDVLEVPRESSDRHPTEKPVKLLAELIEATTTAGQIVADPFGGVASTCVAAKETGRKWWGCELEEKYWRIGEERLLS